MVDASQVIQLPWWLWWLVAGAITAIAASFNLFWFSNRWSYLYIIPLSIILWPLVLIAWYILKYRK